MNNNAFGNFQKSEGISNERAARFSEAGILFQVILVIGVITLGNPHSPLQSGTRLPSIDTLELLVEGSVQKDTVSNEKAILLLSPNCPACIRLSASISNVYPNMRMSIKVIVLGNRAEALAFAAQINPTFTMYFASPESEWGKRRSASFPYIIITDRNGIPTRFGASKESLY